MSLKLADAALHTLAHKICSFTISQEVPLFTGLVFDVVFCSLTVHSAIFRLYMVEIVPP